jgi:gliding motility-associated-like protein
VRILLIIIVSFMIPVASVAQLSAPGKSAVRFTSYPSAPKIKDPVFVFCNTTGGVNGTLNATRPNGSGVYDFRWYKWNDTTKSFTLPLKTETNVTSASLSGLNDGGYKVDIRKGGVYDTSLVGWIFIDKPMSSATLQNRTCDYVALRGKAAVDTFYYRDPANGKRVILPNGVRFLWSSDPSSSIPYPDFEINPQTFNPPLIDVTYKITVTDSLTCISESSFFYESIHVKADFTADPVKGGAPLDVIFTDKSIRGTKKYIWEFGDKTPDGKRADEWIINQDSLWVLGTPFTHTYYIPGEYSVKLTIESLLGCVDSFRLDPKIFVEPSKIDIPNVFTPNGDGLNDFFLVDTKSIRQISIEVFSRSGMKVYSFFSEGKSLKDYRGWDGNFNNTSVKVTPGVYFYIIKAYGWDNITYDSKEYRGIVYLYR